jgi:hypothetical protein
MRRVRFPPSVAEQIGYYVYTLAEPTSGRVFYVGKGTGNRVFSHASAALKGATASEKLATIRKIIRRGRAVRYEIIRHGMSESEAHEVEAALMDYIGHQKLLNLAGGHHTERRGRMTAKEIIALYQAQPIRIKEPALLIIVNRLFERNISPERLYEVTRGNWVLGERREKAEFAFAVYRGVVREVYRIDGWRSAAARGRSEKRQKRWRFRGEVATDKQHYVGGSVERYLKPGAQSPVKYVNC